MLLVRRISARGVLPANTMIPILRSPSREVFDEAVLVLTALGIPFTKEIRGGVHTISVEAEHVDRANLELVGFLNEEPLVPEQLVPAARRGRPWPGVIVYAVLIVLVFHFADRHMFGINWWRVGLIDGAAIRDGEWWRAITALTLHNGLDHLASNLVFGALFGALLAEATGNGLGWGITVLSGFLGNLAHVFMRTGDHRAVGASTAIFGAVGALAAHELVRGWTDTRDIARRWAPLVGGVILLGYLGGGGDNTDVLAHVTGFVAGAVLGLLAARLDLLRRAGPRTQAALALGALALVGAGWWFAIGGGEVAPR
jgi:rhomboid protease GluP